jgi:hypothetical protein
MRGTTTFWPGDRADRVLRDGVVALEAVFV